MPAWWDSPDSLGRIWVWAFWCGVILAGVGIASSVVGFVARNRRDTLLALPQRLDAAEASMRPRSLSDGQRDLLVAGLRQVDQLPLTVLTLSSNGEAVRFSEQIVPALRAAGIVVTEETAQVISLGTIVEGLILQAGPGSGLYVDRLRGAFEKAGLDARIGPASPSIPQGAARLVIAGKPSN